ncbi:MAG: FtsQ-type POTRA domain-containing protein [Candidatus Kapabacteria bacterium]|nr:FtsQ-type POTRA domain-containing protein [Candidatus Kapabacteria bacterium]
MNRTKSKYWVLILILLLVFIISLGYYSNNWSIDRQIAKVNISGNNLVTKEEIMALVAPVLSKVSIGQLKLSDLKRKLENIPLIYQAIISRKNDDILEIKVQERSLFAIVVADDRNTLYIDKSGYILPKNLFPGMHDLIILRNIQNGKFLDSSALSGCVKIIDALNTASDALSCVISEIIYNGINNSFKLMTSAGNIAVVMGKAENIEDKIKRLKIFWFMKMVNQDAGKIKYIDLRWADRAIIG